MRENIKIREQRAENNFKIISKEEENQKVTLFVFLLWVSGCVGTLNSFL